MTNVIVPFSRKPREQAVLLLAAAEELGQPVEVVQTRESAFYAPAEVVEKAGLSLRSNKAEPSEKAVDDAQQATAGVHTVNAAVETETPVEAPKRGGRRKNTQE